MFPPPPLPTEVPARDGLALHLAHWPLPEARPGSPREPHGVVVMLHGLTEHGQRYRDTARRLNEAGWAVVAPDMRGHGRSGGPRGAMTQDDDLLHDLATVLDAVASRYPTARTILLGMSTGGALAARFAAAQALPTEQAPWARPLSGLALSAPALRPTMSLIQRALLSTMGRLIQDVPVPIAFRAEWLSSDPAVIAEFEQDPLIHRRITPRIALFLADSGPQVQQRAADWTVPTLMLYTPQDRLIEPQACIDFMQALPAGLGRTHAFPGLRHDLLREPGQERVHDALREWLQDTFAA